jgi:tRNA threonylcarbamoyladenosine biosynthesis protein TsaE
VRALVSLAELVGVGRSLGERLAPHGVVWLEGELGAGKTTFAQAVAGGLGVTETATSPTYNLVHRYDGAAGPVYHVDCYRLRGADEAQDLDWEGLGRGAALLVEWPERAGAWVLPPTARVRLAYADAPDRRWLEIVE